MLLRGMCRAASTCSVTKIISHGKLFHYFALKEPKVYQVDYEGEVALF